MWMLAACRAAKGQTEGSNGIRTSCDSFGDLVSTIPMDMSDLSEFDTACWRHLVQARPIRFAFRDCGSIPNFDTPIPIKAKGRV